jgi:dinuclear metal center YbgI/SA1388 family protein
MTATVADIISIIDSIAPIGLAEDWDNSGLQVGQPNWPVRNILVALDPLPVVVEEACNRNIDLLITHHPLIFKPLRSINFSTSQGAIIKMAVESKMTIFSAHTNLDSVVGGTNDVMAQKIGLRNIKPLGRGKNPERYKLTIFVPVEYEKKVLDSLLKTNAGTIDRYTSCSFRSRGRGTFKPGSLAKPFIGESGEITDVDEVRIESIVEKKDLEQVVERVMKHHPYESGAYDVYPLFISETAHGIGRIGELDQLMDLESLAIKVKEQLGLKSVKVAGRPDLKVSLAAVCTGSGSGFTGDFYSSGAQVYISGDLHYHDARDIEVLGLGAIDVGHFASEHMVVQELASRLKTILAEKCLQVSVEACSLEKDPFEVY